MVSLSPAPGVLMVEVVLWCHGHLHLEGRWSRYSDGVIETCTWSVDGRGSLMVSLRLAPGVSVVEVV